MFDTKISNEQRKYAWDLVSRVDFGQRDEFNGDKIKQYTGILGETVMADMIGHDRPNGEGGYDNGIDFIIFGVRVDLKTMGREYFVKDHYVNNLVASQLESDTDVYVFASINKNKGIMTVCGSKFKKDFDKYFIPKGTIRKRDDGTEFEVARDMYEITNGELLKSENWIKLTWDIHQYSLL